jgi:hypothetical protein
MMMRVMPENRSKWRDWPRDFAEGVLFEGHGDFCRGERGLEIGC